MKNLKLSLACLLFTLFLFSCGGGSNSSNSSSSSSEVSSDSSDACEDMRSYNSGVEYGANDVRGARVIGNPPSSCAEVLEYYDDNYDQDCFCLGFYKGQSEG